MIRFSIETPDMASFEAVLAAIRGTASSPFALMGESIATDILPSPFSPQAGPVIADAPKTRAPRTPKVILAETVAVVPVVEDAPEVAEIAEQVAEADVGDLEVGAPIDVENSLSLEDTGLEIRRLLAIVREQSTGTVMLDLIAKHGGKSVKDVPPANMAALLVTIQEYLASA